MEHGGERERESGWWEWLDLGGVFDLFDLGEALWAILGLIGDALQGLGDLFSWS